MIKDSAVPLSDEKYARLIDSVARMSNKAYGRVADIVEQMHDDEYFLQTHNQRRNKIKGFSVPLSDEKYARLIDSVARMSNERYTYLVDMIAKHTDEEYVKEGGSLPQISDEERVKLVYRAREVFPQEHRASTETEIKHWEYINVEIERRASIEISENFRCEMEKNMEQHALKITNNVYSSMVFARLNHCSDKEVSSLIVKHDQDLNSLGPVKLFSYYDRELKNKLYFMHLNNAQDFFLTMLLPNTENTIIAKRCFASVLAR